MYDTTTQALRPQLGPDSTYRRLHQTPGEGHQQRGDLLPGGNRQARNLAEATAGEPHIPQHVAHLVHLTDFQLADLASPARVEYAEKQDGAEWARMRPSYRPQEFLQTHALWNIVRTIRELTGVDTWDLAVSTGDHIDSMQANELDAYLRLLDGGSIDPAFGTRGFRDAPTLSGDPTFWHPEPGNDNQWNNRYGLPACPGVLAAAREELTSTGMGLPWIATFGNHDCLVQGRTALPEGWDEFTTGAQKPIDPPFSIPSGGDVLDAYVADPNAFTNAPARTIAADPQRRSVSRAEYMQAHLAAPGLPRGHGFTPANVGSGRAYFVYDGIPGVRVISLDSTNPHGHVDGRIDDEQFQWLRERLVEVHSQYVDESGRMVDDGGGGQDRLVVVCSHHGTSTMTNAYGEGNAHLADDVVALLHRFANVVLWLNGHTHINRITAHPLPHEPRTGPPRAEGAGGGLWEISTSAIAEWPVQIRTLQIDTVAATPQHPGALRIRSTMVDSQAPAEPEGTWASTDLAALHREVAANDPGSVGGLYAEGDPSDRNCDLWLPLPAGWADTLAQ